MCKQYRILIQDNENEYVYLSYLIAEENYDKVLNLITSLDVEE